VEGQKTRRRVWRKLHLAVDPVTHDIVAAEVLLKNVHDAEVLPTLLNPLRRKLGHVYADGAYDSKACHQLISRKGATACIPPRKSAGLWKKGHPRDDAVLVEAVLQLGNAVPQLMYQLVGLLGGSES
jgi:hypothetical protein